jgi:hypothetical protein
MAARVMAPPPTGAGRACRGRLREEQAEETRPRILDATVPAIAAGAPHGW